MLVNVQTLLSIVVLVTAVWAFADASSIRRVKNLPRGPGGYAPLEWGIFVALLWIVGFPLYIVRRGEANARTTLTAEEYDRLAAYQGQRRNPVMFALGVILLLVGAGVFLVGFAPDGKLTVAGAGLAVFVLGCLALRKPRPRKVVAPPRIGSPAPLGYGSGQKR